MSGSSPTECCGVCAHFVDDPRELERQLTGLTILSSAWGDTRGDQGLCELHELFLQPAMTCPRFVGRAPAGADDRLPARVDPSRMWKSPG